MMDKNAWFQRAIPNGATVLEIGPLDKPIVRNDDGSVQYADHLTTKELQVKYAGHPGVDLEAIQPVTHVIGEAGLLAAVGSQRFRVIVASHVFEHVPNPIQWLLDVHAILEDNGELLLALPDYRFCFDSLRAPTRTAEWIDAYIRKLTRPPARAIFDAEGEAVHTHDGQITWSCSGPMPSLRRIGGKRRALELAREAEANGHYHDCHCSCFTPASFVELLRDLVNMELTSLSLREITPTFGFEFLVKLRRDDALSWEDRVAGIPRPEGARYAAIPKSFDARAYLQHNRDVAAARFDPYDHYIEYGEREGRRFRY
jgi:hypothetical protein